MTEVSKIPDTAVSLVGSPGDRKAGQSIIKKRTARHNSDQGEEHLAWLLVHNP